MVLPPRTQRFKKNTLHKFHRGFAFKVPRDFAKNRFDLETNESVVWIAPDGSRILTDRQATLNNARRRSSLNISDAWRDLKALAPEKAKEIGWNGFQRLNRGMRGSRVGILKRLRRIGVDVETEQELAQASEGQLGENNGWGDSG